MMQRRSSFFGMCLALLAGIMFVTTDPQTSGAAQATQTVSGQARARYIGFVPPSFTDPAYVEMADGVRTLAATKGWKFEVYAPASATDVASQGIIVQQFIEKGVEAISVNAINPDTITTGVKIANAAHVPFFVHNSLTPLADTTAEVAAYIGFDQWGGAEKLGRYTCQLLARKYNLTPEKAHGKVFILLDIESVSSHRRTQGYKAGLKLCPDVQLIGEQTADGVREKGAAAAIAALQKTPDIDVFYGNNDEMSIGAALAAQRLGLTLGKDFFALGIDGSKSTVDLIRQGRLTATLGVDPFRIGYTVVNAVDTVLSGGKIPQFLMTPTVVVDASNIDDYVAGKTWTEPVAGSPELDNGKPTVGEAGASATASAAATANK